MKPLRPDKRWQDIALIAVLGLAMAFFAFYIVHWYLEQGRIREEGVRYALLYDRGETPAPSLGLEEIVWAEPPQPAEIFEANETAAPAPSALPPSPAPTPSPEPEALRAIPALPTVRDIPVIPDSTPDADTLVMLMPTEPPRQESFSELLMVNPDTAGYLEIPELLELPVVQRINDNEYYLDHSFTGAEAKEGALFLDGANRLVPEDDCLIIYGHNMRNGTMFGKLDRYESADFLHQHPLARFDTLYENRVYVPFAAFTASMEPGNRHYFDVRQFIFDEVDFDLFTLKLQSRSMYSIPVDVAYGDRLLLLVTCEYTNDDGRLILALRQLRPEETEAEMETLVRLATEK